jgi:purine nucleosidase
MFHDPLAAATIFEKGLCEYERGTVEIELLSDNLKGLTYWKPGNKGPHEVAKTVNKEKFFEHYFSIVK